MIRFKLNKPFWVAYFLVFLVLLGIQQEGFSAEKIYGEGTPFAYTNAQNLSEKLTVGHFEKTGQMHYSRFAPGVIKLKDGRVLVFGGQQDTHSADFRIGEKRPMRAEIYDPKTGQYSLTGDVAVGRVDYGYDLLKDGRVIIAGGQIGMKTLSEIEVYDPKSEKFSVVAQLRVPRKGPNVKTLPNGKVLIIGGNMYEKTAELFDPETNKIELLKSEMSEWRRIVNAIVLGDGRVFVCGASHFAPVTDIFDYRDLKFKPVAPMLDNRLSTMIVQLTTGEVLIAGGLLNLDPTKPTYFKTIYTSLIYNPKNNEWRYSKSLIKLPAAEGNSVLLDNGKVLIGGVGDKIPYLKPEFTSLQLYDPKMDTIEALGYMKVRYYNPKFIKLNNGNVLIVGKSTDKNTAFDTEIYVPN